jgi:hypothetical protein
MAMSPEARDLMAGAYSTRESVGMTIDQILTAKVLSPKDREQVIEDSLRGAPQAKAAWPRSTSLEDITRNVAAINVPMVVIAGELDRVDSVGLLKAELLSRISARRPLRLAGYRPSLAAGVSAGAWSTDRRLRRCTSGRRAEQDGRQNEAVGHRGALGEPDQSRNLKIQETLQWPRPHHNRTRRSFSKPSTRSSTSAITRQQNATGRIATSSI